MRKSKFWCRLDSRLSGIKTYPQVRVRWISEFYNANTWISSKMSRFVVSQVGFVRRWKKELLIKGSFNEDVLLHLAVYFAAANFFFFLRITRSPKRAVVDT